MTKLYKFHTGFPNHPPFMCYWLIKQIALSQTHTIGWGIVAVVGLVEMFKYTYFESTLEMVFTLKKINGLFIIVSAYD